MLVYFFSTSYSVGLLLNCIGLLTYFTIKYNKNIFKMNKKFIIFITVILIMISCSIIENLYQIKSLYKTLLSIPLLTSVLYSAYVTSRYIRYISIDEIKKVVNLTFFLFLMIAILDIALDFNKNPIYGIRTPPFLEPSHFSLSFGVLAMLNFVFQVKNKKIMIMASTTLVAILFPNTTLLTFVFLMGILMVTSKNIMYLGAISCFLLIGFSQLEVFHWFIGHVNIFDENNKNLSMLVYVQGVEMIYNSLTDNIFGVGFQNLISLPMTYTGEKILEIHHVILNIEDGSFFASKFISELGWPALLMVCIYLYIFIKSYVYIKKNITTPSISLFSSILIYASFPEFFVRGLAYFSPSLFFFFVGLFLSFRNSSTSLRLSSSLKEQKTFKGQTKT